MLMMIRRLRPKASQSSSSYVDSAHNLVWPVALSRFRMFHGRVVDGEAVDPTTDGTG